MNSIINQPDTCSTSTRDKFLRAIAQGTAALLMAVIVSAATATLPPGRRDFPSPNGSFVLDADPESGVYTIYAASNRATPVWSFRSQYYYWENFVADDGSAVCGVLDAELPRGPLAIAAITFWNQSGATQAYNVDELCPNPPRVWAPKGQRFADGTVRWRDAVALDGNVLKLTTARNVRFAFRLSDGAIISRVEPMVTPQRVLIAVAVLVVVLGLAGYKLHRRRLKSQPK